MRNCAELVTAVDEIGFLPLLNMGLGNWSAEGISTRECQYRKLPNGSWEWPLWKWKGQVIEESGCAYGRFFRGNKGFVSKALWPDFCNFRRAVNRHPAQGSVEEAILSTLQDVGSMTTKDLRKACGFTGDRHMRSRFDAFLARLERSCYIVTEDFVYPLNRHGNEYGWGLSLLTTPERLMGYDACRVDRDPEESRQAILDHFGRVMPLFPPDAIKRFVLS